MTPIAIACLIGSTVLVGGGLIASIIALMRHPERADYPPGGEEEPAEG